MLCMRTTLWSTLSRPRMECLRSWTSSTVSPRLLNHNSEYMLKYFKEMKHTHLYICRPYSCSQWGPAAEVYTVLHFHWCPSRQHCHTPRIWYVINHYIMNELCSSLRSRILTQWSPLFSQVSVLMSEDSPQSAADPPTCTFTKAFSQNRRAPRTVVSTTFQSIHFNPCCKPKTGSIPNSDFNLLLVALTAATAWKHKSLTVKQREDCVRLWMNVFTFSCLFVTADPHFFIIICVHNKL